MAQGDGQGPKYFVRSTAFIVGLTGLILAIVGLRAAINSFNAPPSNSAPAYSAPSPPTEQIAEPANQASNIATASENQVGSIEPAPTPIPAPAPAVAALPLVYSKPNGTLEFSNGQWVETDSATGSRLTFSEISRADGTTVIYDRSRDLYLRWPTQGGTVQWSRSNPMQWTDLYIVTPVDRDE